MKKRVSVLLINSVEIAFLFFVKLTALFNLKKVLKLITYVQKLYDVRTEFQVLFSR